MKRIALSAIAAAVSLAGQTAFAETVYDCEIKVFTNNGWIAPRVIVMWNEEDKSARVYDRYVHKLVGEPLQVKVEQRNEVSYNLDWRVDDIPVSNARMSMDGLYAAVLNVQKNTLSVRNVRTGARGRGKCKVKQG
ncbi:hypothetical protein [Leisingera sp. ANG-M7]|uniref:hypothetical protein n=1 Tax=Leisingera sp. ANG-M7 TaxID=1577902 RepID=UPI00057E2357|nr:hypothetical protein [Leisingera sp. ANG-M7]KIC37270.1 hypothetical protein RA26_08280 [Leisingera sp. ANG-M7]